MGPSLLPVAKCGDGGHVLDRLLGNVLVVDDFVASQRRLQVVPASESRRRQHLADTSVKALDHTVGLRVTGWAQTMLNAQRFASHIELVNWLPLSVSSWTMFMGAACSRRFRKSTQLSSL